MRVNQLLVNLLNSVLGPSRNTSGGNYSYKCPKCKHRKNKLEVNLDQESKHFQSYQCWVCGDDFSGKSLLKLFRRLKASQEQVIELSKYVKVRTTKINNDIESKIELPKEFKKFDSSFESRRALAYLKQRGITEKDIERYNIGYCTTGKFQNRIIIPSYDKDGNLNYFIGRSFEEWSSLKYKNPTVTRDIIPFEYYINWNIPIILCEGAFDMMAIKRNAIPLLGKSINNALMKKIISSQVDKIYLALDNDAIKKTLKYSEYLLKQGKEVYIVDTTENDPSDLGFDKFVEILQQTQPIDEYSFMSYKLQLI